MERLQRVLDAPVPTRAPTKEHLLLKAAIVAADKGTFEAIISSEAVDRDKDIVLADAMVKALQAWTTSDKKIPLLRSHSSKAEDVVGHVLPESAKAVNGEVLVSGWIDQSVERGKQAWRLVKSGTLGFSFGYLIADAVKRDDGIREIRELDVYEISCCSVPMQHSTRVVGWKGADREPMSLDELRRLEARLGLTRRQQEADEFTATIRAAMDPAHAHRDSAKTLRTRAENTAREFAPVVISTFDA